MVMSPAVRSQVSGKYPAWKPPLKATLLSLTVAGTGAALADGMPAKEASTNTKTDTQPNTSFVKCFLSVFTKISPVENEKTFLLDRSNRKQPYHVIPESHPFLISYLTNNRPNPAGFASGSPKTFSLI